jgi:Ca2+:H+ antiporter
MDLSLSIAIGSSVQVALFVAPVLVLASLFVGPAPMDLAFPPGLVLIVFLAVLITGQVASDGRSDCAVSGHSPNGRGADDDDPKRISRGYHI